MIPECPYSDPDPDWYRDIGKNTYRFDPMAQALRVVNKDREDVGVSVAVEYRKGPDAYKNFQMSDADRTALLRWWKEQDAKPF